MLQKYSNRWEAVYNTIGHRKAVSLIANLYQTLFLVMMV